MLENKLNPGQVLNPALLKVNPQREKVEAFKANLGRLIEQVNEGETEEFHKNLLSDFLKETYYSPQYFINTKGRNDLVIHNGKTAKTAVGVMIEAKRPGNQAEMPKVGNLNVKALQELVLYFLRERVTGKNIEIKHLIITNVYEWFIFDAKLFDRLFAQDWELVRKFNEFEQKQLSGDKTEFFYKEIAQPAIAARLDKIEFTHGNLRDYATALRGDDPAGEKELISLYKLLSPEHLLKLPFANDSNRLNKPFYNELLYIIGLAETKAGGKKVIGRVKEGDRRGGSLIENAISRLDSLGKIARLTKPEEFGDTDEEQLFNVALRLSINWINRILFLKLLEAQLIKYHQGDRQFAFLNLQKVKSYDDLESLFFDVLAKEVDQREARVKEIFADVPYLNSSLFEPTATEQETIVISNLQDRSLPIFSATVLKDGDGKRRSGELNALEYLFEFLAAYDFSSDESEDDQADSEKLINAAVLGLIFEKINGYKDGSFYTPSFITMYMCRETIRRAIVQKFNEVKGWNCASLDDLYEKIEDKLEANQIINSLKICDPAVGSGHFLVSALNEIIAIKSELRVLLDRSGKSLRDYRVEVKNDKLLVYDDEGNLFAYRPNNAEKQRVQEALFHEKQTLIEGCLFGVDINPNSVKICQLRLWIELLKNAYYRADGNLETLPNIDINIKCGNSLISRFPLDLKVASGKSQSMIEKYRQAVRDYQQAKDKGQKREIERLINDIKGSFRTTLTGQDPNKTKLRNLEVELYQLENQVLLFEESAKEKKAREKQVTKLCNEIDKLRAEIADIESGRLYDQALEWRFEFPEVLNEQGDFVGFDVVIGNPPYIQLSKTDYITHDYKNYLLNRYETSGGRLNTFIFFIHLSSKILKPQGFLSYIVPNTILTQEYYAFTRKFMIFEVQLTEVINFIDLPFEDAVVETVIIQFCNEKKLDYKINHAKLWETGFELCSQVVSSTIKNDSNYYLTPKTNTILLKIFEYKNVLLGDICNINQAIALKGDKSLSLRHENNQGHFKKILDGRNIKKYSIEWGGVYLDYDINKIHSCKRQDIFETKEKLFFRRVSTDLIFTYDNSQHYALNTLIVVNLKTENYINLKFILALMNSSLMNYIYTNKFKSTKTVFSEIQARSVSQLPVRYIDINQQSRYINLVDKILIVKRNDPNADTSQLETEIDHLVYKLYQLTYDEVKIIDPDFPLTPQQYANLKIE